MLPRRSLLQKLIYSAIFLGSAGLPYIFSRVIYPDKSARLPAKNLRIYHDLLRPPGALANDSDFVTACISCGLCAEVCPPACIQFYRDDGARNANTPYIAPAEKACTLCGKCMEVCPSSALLPTPREHVNMGVAQIDRDACYPWVDHGVCGACAVSCPLGSTAIVFAFANMYRPIVQEACVGCGVCVEVCPHPSLPIRIVKASA